MQSRFQGRAALAALFFISFCSFAAEQSCFKRETNARLSFWTVMRGGAMPLDARTKEIAAESPLYPGNAFYAHRAVGPSPRAALRDGNDVLYRNFKGIWANYCTPTGLPGTDCRRDANLAKGNYMSPPLETDFAENPSQPGRLTRGYQVRPIFRSYANADACTLAQTAAALGRAPEVIQGYLARGHGLRGIYRDAGDPVSEARLLKLARAHRFSADTQGLYLEDICLLEPYEGMRVRGIVLDYEVWDRRSPAVATALVRNLRRLLDMKNQKLIFYTNSLQKPATRIANGIDESNAHEIMEIADAFSPVVWSGATPGGHMMPAQERRWTFMESLLGNLEILKAGGRLQVNKILPTISLYDLSAREARELHDFMKASRFNGVKIWNNGVANDLECRNTELQKVLRCLVTAGGDCSTAKKAPRHLFFEGAEGDFVVGDFLEIDLL